MRRNEVELIAALVEGRLEDETEARALIESSEAHRAEYEAQKLAYEALSSIPTAELTEHERAALHRDIWTELQASPAAAPRATPWYYRWSAAAAGLLLIVGLVVVVDQTNPDFTPTAAFREAANELTEETQTASEPSGDDGTTGQPPAATAAGEGDAAEEMADSAFAAPVDPDITRLKNLAVETRIGDLRSFGMAAAEFEPEQLDEFIACIESAGLEDHEVVGDVVAENHYIVAVPEGIEVGPNTPVSFVDIEACTIVHTEE